ncbi:DNA cytosine methyltransferase [Chitinolyticbacter meiyuanensis]|uniref:DNA cytosine methyltransferase n=1 Tax=Chitinolyticbacter meiyuanensis TaxID=682798 RepID=UPI0011E5CE47|nr:DNA cytosine methyltransferase [Chitinolyticbacter meiyuanensis]
MIAISAIDLLCGAGGFTEGARRAKRASVHVVWAANHKQACVDTHKANHPETQHECQDIHQANWHEVPAHDLCLAAPCCQGHSPARGKANGNPQHDASRSTAWAPVSAIEVCRPRLGALIENVPEFMQWRLYPAWVAAMNSLGLAVSPHVVDLADLGVPQHRRRLFIALTRSKHPIKLRLPQHSHVPASSFLRLDEGAWSPIEKPGRSNATLRRVARGRAEFGDTFLMPYYSSGSGLTGRSIDRPIGTITTRDRWAIVKGDQMRMLSVPEARDAMTFGQDYKLPSQRRLAMEMLGNAIPPEGAAKVIDAFLEAA